MTDANRAVFRDRRRAESFGSAARLYDRTRPSYPDELINWLGESGTGSAADVGCGTGQVARLLAGSGWDVVGVEIDERMADVARSHGLDVDVSSFEEWKPAKQFDLIASGQAWHWVDPNIGYQHAAELLRAGGRLALFWNSYRYDASAHALFQDVLSRRAPGLLTDSVPFGSSSPDHAALDAQMVRDSGPWFAEPEFVAFTHGRLQTVDEWLAELDTHSPIRLLDPHIRDALHADLRTSLADLGADRLQVEYETRVTSTIRR